MGGEGPGKGDARFDAADAGLREVGEFGDEVGFDDVGGPEDAGD